MRIQVQKLIIVLCVFAGIFQSHGKATFPIVNNPAVVEFSAGTATDGTNYFVIMGTQTALSGQVFSASGTLIGAQVAIGGHAGFPPDAAVAFGQSNYLVVWSDQTVTKGVTIFGQFISKSGTKVGVKFNLLSTRGSHGFQTVRALASDGANFLLVWQDDNDRSFYGQIITSTGALSGAAFFISNQEQNGKSAAVTFGAGQYFVVWQSNDGSDGDMNKTFGAFVSTAGVAQSPFQISDSISTDQNPLTVAFDGNNYFAVWSWDPGPETFTSVTNWDLLGRLVSPDGSLPGSELSLVANAGSEIFPTLAFDGSKYLLAWGGINYNSDLTFNPNDSNIYLQFFDTGGEAMGSQFSVFTGQGKNTPFIAYNGLTFGGGRFAMAGTLGTIASVDGNISGFPSAAVFGAIISTNGTAGNLHFSTDLVAIPPLGSVQFSGPGVDSLGRTIVSWNWNFGDGATSTDQNPSHVYTKIGAFKPTLMMTNSDQVALTGTGPAITVSSPTAQFVAGPTEGVLPLQVQFFGPDADDFGTSLVSWNWDFGDGTTGQFQSPTHTYSRVGTFFPTFLGTNNNGIAVRGTGPTITVLAYTSANRISVSDSWHDTLVNDPDLGPFVRTSAHSTLNVTLPMTDDISSFDATTSYNVSIGGLSSNGSLGDDPTYHKGKTSVSFQRHDDDTGKVIAMVTISWTAKSFTITASASYDAFDAESVYGGTSGPIHDTGEATIQLGNSSVDVPIYVSGQNTDVFNDNAGVDLNTGSISAQADFGVPTVSISAPAANFSTTDTAVFVSGTATDSISLGQVYWRLASASDDPRFGYYGYGDWQTVDALNTVTDPAKTGTWAVGVDISGNGPGTNRFWVVSTDSSGNASVIVTRNFFYSVRSTLTLATNGPGGITPGKGVSNGAQLEIGRGYSVTAKALGTSNVFFNWTDGNGNVVSPNAVFNFVMQDSLTLVANFGPNPFPATVGSYTGLFFDADNGVSVDTAGYLSVTTTKTGGYTGSLLLGASKYPVSGQFLFNGNPDDPTAADSSFVIKRGTLPPLFGSLHIPSNPSGGLLNTMTGNIEVFDSTQDEWVVAPLSLALSHYTAGNPVAGVYNLQIPTSSGSAQNGPLGYGYGSATVSSKGSVTLMLHLPDKNVPPVSFSASLAADGSFPFFIPLYTGKGLVTGWLTFTNEVTDDIRGENITWIKLANPANKFYPDGFDRTFEVTGSRYVAPKTGTNIMGWTSGLLDFGDSNFSGEVAVTFNPKSNTLTVNSGQGNILSKATLSFVVATGTISGSFTPVNAKAFTFSALALPKADNAFGFFLDTDQSGYILLSPSP